MSRHDVIVIGAGFAGLSAATAMMQAGLDVVVLEANDRVGGRVESHLLSDGTRIDTGGQFLCRDMPEVNALAKAFGNPVIPAFVDGDEVYVPALTPARGEEIWASVEALRERAIATNINDSEVSRLTVSQWAQQQDVEPEVRNAYLRLIDGLWCRSPDDISFAWLADNDRRITNEYSEMEAFPGGTMHALAERLASDLGDRVRLGHRVTGINHRPDSATVACGSATFEAARIIIAVPPVMASRIAFDPPPPPDIIRALAAWGVGDVIKVFVRYRAPFWRDRGLSGTVIFSQPRGLYACDAGRGALAGLVTFIGGPLAREWHGKPREALEAFVRDNLILALGDEAADIAEFSIRDWTDDTGSGGAYSDSVVDVEAGDAETPLRDGFGPIRFAPSELSPRFPGYVEGAITMGRIAAREAITALRA